MLSGYELMNLQLVYKHFLGIKIYITNGGTLISFSLQFLGCVYLANFWLESGFSNVFQANLEVDKRKAFFKRL